MKISHEWIRLLKAEKDRRNYQRRRTKKLAQMAAYREKRREYFREKNAEHYQKRKQREYPTGTWDFFLHPMLNGK